MNHRKEWKITATLSVMIHRSWDFLEKSIFLQIFFYIIASSMSLIAIFCNTIATYSFNNLVEKFLDNSAIQLNVSSKSSKFWWRKLHRLLFFAHGVTRLPSQFIHILSIVTFQIHQWKFPLADGLMALRFFSVFFHSSGEKWIMHRCGSLEESKSTELDWSLRCLIIIELATDSGLVTA